MALGLFALYVCAQRVDIASYDGKVMVSVARNLVDHGSLRTSGPDPFGFNTPYSVYGIGVSLLAVPAYALQKVLGLRADLLVTLVNPMVLALSGMLVHRVSRLLGAAPRAAVAAGLAFGALSMALWASTEMFSEPGVTLGQLVMMLGLLRWRQGAPAGPWMAGTGVAVAILFRTDSAILLGVALAVVPWLIPDLVPRLRERWREVAGVVVPVAAAVVWLLIYNQIRFGSPLASRYDGGGFTTPILFGLRGLLLSPGKGFFFFNPVLILGIPGLFLLARRDRAVGAVLALLVVVRLVFYALWHSWSGGIAWGPRFLLPLCAVFAIGLGVWLTDLSARATAPGRVARGAIIALVAVGAVVSVESVWVPYEQWVNRFRYVPPVGTAAQQKARKDELSRRLIWTVPGSHLTGNLRLLDESAAFPLRHFKGGPSPVGVGALFVAGAASAAAFAAASGYRMTLRPRATSPDQ